MEQHHHPSAPSSEPRPPGAALAQRPLSRRTVLRAGALATAAVGLAGAVPGAFGGARPAAAAALPRLSRDAATAAEHVPAYPASWTVRPFNLTEVSLGESVFTRAQQQMVDLARAYPVDRVLVVFRRNANLT